MNPATNFHGPESNAAFSTRTLNVVGARFSGFAKNPFGAVAVFVRRFTNRFVGGLPDACDGRLTDFDAFFAGFAAFLAGFFRQTPDFAISAKRLRAANCLAVAMIAFQRVKRKINHRPDRGPFDDIRYVAGP